MQDRFESQLRFIIEIDKLKSVLRRTYLIDSDRLENSGEHSWHLAMAAMVFAEHANEPVNIARVVQMVLVHDIVEIDAGDTYFYDVGGELEKAEREKAAADRIFRLLPGEQGEEMRRLWEEFEARNTPDARFAAALDRFIPQIHNYYANGRSWQENGVTADRILERNAGIAQGSRRLWQCTQALVADAVSRGILKES
jgi:putative hydrolase of HD superfamily